MAGSGGPQMPPEARPASAAVRQAIFARGGVGSQSGPQSCRLPAEHREQTAAELCKSLAKAGPDGVLPLSQAQRLVERTVGALGAALRQVCYVPAQPELNFPEMRKLPFAGYLSEEEFSGPTSQVGQLIDDSNADAMLVVAMGTDFSAAREMVEFLRLMECVPLILVVSIVPFFTTDAPLALSLDGYGPAPGRIHFDPCDPTSSVELGQCLQELYPILFEEGADDVHCLLGGELINPHRILECLHKSEFAARQLSEFVDIEVAAIEEKVVRKLRNAYGRFLFGLADGVLENIPGENSELEEILDDNGDLVRLENFEVEAKISGGAIAKVYRVQHAEYETKVIKMISKATVKNADVMLGLNRELCMMQHLAPHPNVVKVLAVMHSKNNFHAVMEYSGHWHLQVFTEHYLWHHGNDTLPTELVNKFARQQGAAVQHLHKSMICHRDLKPHTWIVNDAGDALRLDDFGLAIQVCNRAQPLRQSCGSLPFCPPEVFDSGKASEGYDAFAADIWSLGVCFIELSSGPFYTERLLDWIPVHPRNKDDILRGLTNLPELWKQRVVEPTNASIGRVISHTLVLDPEWRWRIHTLVGPEGLGRAPSALTIPAVR